MEFSTGREPEQGAGHAAEESGIAERFREHWTGPQDPQSATAELLPVRLARACVQVLPVDGAGLSLFHDDFRVPLGASDEMATLAERLQFTQGEGPCLDAGREKRVLVADHEQLLERWPRFTDELFTHTPFRAVVSLPLRTTGGASGALDLFLVDPDRLDSVTIADAIAITDEIAAAFAIAQAMSSSEWKPDPGSDLEPSWLRTPNSHARATVWIASGVLMTRLHLSASDAVALMRSFAYGHDTVLDQVASDIVHGTLDAGRLLP